MDKNIMIDEYPLQQINAFVREEKYPDHYAAVCQEVQSYLTEKMADHEKGAAVFSHQDVDRCERLILSADPQNQKTGIRVLRTIVEALEPIGKTNMYGSLGYFGEKWDEDQLAVYQEYADELESQTAYFLRSLGEPDPLEISEITSLRECARLLGEYYWKVQMAYMEAGSSSVITAEINMSQIIAEQEKRRVAREQEAADAIPLYDVYCQDYSRCQIKALRGKEVAEYVERLNHITPEEEQTLVQRAIESAEKENNEMSYDLLEQALYVCKENEERQRQLTQLLADLTMEGEDIYIGTVALTIKAVHDYAETFDVKLRKQKGRAQELIVIVQYLQHYVKQLLEFYADNEFAAGIMKRYDEVYLKQLNEVYGSLKVILGGNHTKVHLEMRKNSEKAQEERVVKTKEKENKKETAKGNAIGKESTLSREVLLQRFEEKLMKEPTRINAAEVDRVRAHYAAMIKEKEYKSPLGEQVEEIRKKWWLAPDATILAGDRIRKILLALLCLVVLVGIRMTPLKNLLQTDIALYVVLIACVLVCVIVGVASGGFVGFFIGGIVGMIAGNILAPVITYLYMPILLIGAVVFLIRGLRSNRFYEKKREKWIKNSEIPGMVQEAKGKVELIQKNLTKVTMTSSLQDVVAYYKTLMQALERYSE